MLDLKQYFVKEHAGFFKAKGTFDIINPETKERIGIARETTGAMGQIMKAALGKAKGPVKISISETEKGPAVVEIRRPWSFLFSPKIHVHESGNHLGWFKKKKFSMTGGLHIFDGSGKKVGEIQGSWRGGNFTFKAGDGAKLGEISKKWAGLGRELFTSADNYMVSVEEGQPASTGALLLAAAIVLDSLYYDGGGKTKAAAAGEDEE